MTDNRSFHAILSEKMNLQNHGEDAKPQENSPNSSLQQPHFTTEQTRTSNHTHATVSPNHAPFDLMSQLLGSKKAHVFNSLHGVSQLKNPYRTTTPLAKKAAPAPNEKTILIGQLSKIQKSALEKLVFIGGDELRDLEILGETCLKKCFRRLAKVLHPDTKQQSSQNFRELREAYNILLSAFSKAEPQKAA